MFLETTDGVAIIGYAGLGATAKRTEPSDWMTEVLRGRKLPLEQSLGVLAKAMSDQLPRHMIHMPANGQRAHHMLIAAFVDKEVRFYSIDLMIAPDRKGFVFQYTRWATNDARAPAPRPPRLAIGGSGAYYLKERTAWRRSLLRLVNAHDRRKISSQALADHLATINHHVYLGTSDQSVGPRCIVAWRFRKGGVYDGGGGHQFYTERTRDVSSPMLPTIMNGMHVSSIVEVLMPHSMKSMEAMLAGEPSPELDVEKINAELHRLPHEPDENLA